MISIFLFSINFFWSNFSALNSFLLWINFTLDANFVRNIASSTAAFPPPTTATTFSLKKKPSHVAHAETPKPLNFCSDSKFNHLAWAPVEIIMLSAVYFWPLSPTASKGVDFKFTDEMWSSIISVPTALAWSLIWSINHGPWITSAKPGKFSTSVVVVNCPPGAEP